MSDQLREAAAKALATLTDEQLGTWRYMESSEIYDDFREAAEALRAALSHPEHSGAAQPVQVEPVAPVTDSFVQPVPDKCDRITWRGRYYSLPPAAAPSLAPDAPADQADAIRFRWLCEHPDWHFIEHLCREFVADSSMEFLTELRRVIDARRAVDLGPLDEHRPVVVAHPSHSDAALQAAPPREPTQAMLEAAVWPHCLPPIYAQRSNANDPIKTEPEREEAINPDATGGAQAGQWVPAAERWPEIGVAVFWDEARTHWMPMPAYNASPAAAPPKAAGKAEPQINEPEG